MLDFKLTPCANIKRKIFRENVYDAQRIFEIEFDAGDRGLGNDGGGRKIFANGFSRARDTSELRYPYVPAQIVLRKKKMFDEELTKRGLTEKIYIDNTQNLLRRNFYADNIN